MKNHDINSSSIDESLFDLSHSDVPNTSALQSRILDKTKNLPQLNEQKQQNSNVSFLKRVIEPKFIGAFAVAASVALVAVLWVPNMEEKSLNQVDADLFTSEDDLDFQETMILFDEQMFAHL